MAYGRHCAEEAAVGRRLLVEARHSMELVERQELQALVIVAKKKHGSAHSDRHSVEILGAEAVLHSMVE